MIAEFFKEVDDAGSGKFSVSRLVYFLSFFPAAYHIVVTGQDVGTFITTYTAGYVASKHGGGLIDALGNKGAKQDADDTVELTK
jgi:hypothetical protein